MTPYKFMVSLYVNAFEDASCYIAVIRNPHTFKSPQFYFDQKFQYKRKPKVAVFEVVIIECKYLHTRLHENLKSHLNFLDVRKFPLVACYILLISSAQDAGDAFLLNYGNHLQDWPASRRGILGCHIAVHCSTWNVSTNISEVVGQHVPHSFLESSAILRWVSKFADMLQCHIRPSCIIWMRDAPFSWFWRWNFAAFNSKQRF